MPTPPPAAPALLLFTRNRRCPRHGPIEANDPNATSVPPRPQLLANDVEGCAPPPEERKCDDGSSTLGGASPERLPNETPHNIAELGGCREDGKVTLPVERA